jgi:hypothetical protein
MGVRPRNIGVQNWTPQGVIHTRRFSKQYVANPISWLGFVQLTDNMEVIHLDEKRPVGQVANRLGLSA